MSNYGSLDRKSSEIYVQYFQDIIRYFSAVANEDTEHFLEY